MLNIGKIEEGFVLDQTLADDTKYWTTLAEAWINNVVSVNK